MQTVILTSNRAEKQVVYQFRYVSAFLDFSDKIVRHDNSSVHVQGSNTPCESSRIQIAL